MLKTLLLVLATGLILSPSASVAKSLFRYQTDGGTISFTDNPDQIPARYRAAARKLSMPTLESYARLTVVPRGATSAPAVGLEGERRGVQSRAAEGSRSHVPRSLYYALGGQTALEIPLATAEPVVVRRLQWRRVEHGGLSYWKAFTVIEQAGRTLTEIEPN